MTKRFNYRFEIEGNGKRREVCVLGSCPVQAETKLHELIKQDNKKKKRSTRVVRFVGI